MVLVVVLAVLASTRPLGAAASAPPDPSATSPEAVRWRAAQVIPASEMPGWFVTHDYEFPTADLVDGSGLVVDSVRDRTIRGAHERVFESVDGTYTLTTDVHELMTARLASFRRTDNAPLAGPFPAGARAWTDRDDAGGRGFMLEMSRGRVLVDMTLEATPVGQGGPPTDVVVRTLADLAGRQAPMLRDSPDLDVHPLDSPQLLQQLLIALVLAYLLWFQLLIALAASATDRGFRDHARAWFAQDPHQAPREVVVLPDVSAEVRRRHRRHRRAVVVRSVVVGALVAGVYEARPEFGIAGVLGLLALVAFIVAVVDVLRERRRARRTTGAAPGTALSVRLVVASLVSVVLASGGAVAVFFVAMAAIDDPAGVTPEQKKGALLLYLALGVLCFLLSDVPMRLVRRYALRRASNEASSDPRREIPAALVRRRWTTGAGTPRHGRLDRRALVDAAARGLRAAAGPRAQPGWARRRDRRTRYDAPPLGATRQYYGDDEWRDAVDRMAQSSQLVVLTVGRSEGIVEEVRRIRRAGLLAKCLFVIPPVGRDEARARLRVLSWALDVAPRVLAATDEVGHGSSPSASDSTVASSAGAAPDGPTSRTRSPSSAPRRTWPSTRRRGSTTSSRSSTASTPVPRGSR